MFRNCILITIDSLRADYLCCYGYERETSPNIDQLADEGILCNQAISNGGHTRIAFPAIFTSTYLFSKKFLEKTSNGYIIRLFDDRPYLPEILKYNRYKTAGFHSNPFLTKRYGYGRGFDVLFDPFEEKERNYGSKGSIIEHSIQSYFKSKFCRLFKLIHHRFSPIRPFARSEQITKYALSWIKNNKDNPFFVWIHYMDVHHPYLPPKKYLMKFSSKYISSREAINLHYKMLKNPESLSEYDIKKLINLYEGCIRYTDDWVGKLLNEIDYIGLLDKTLIILTSDHGDSLGEHGNFGHGERSVNLYDEVIRVPLIIKVPEMVGKQINNQVELLDISPTILDFLSIKVPNTMVGKSILNKNYDGKDIVFSQSLDVGANAYIDQKAFTDNLENEFDLIKIRGVISCRTKHWKYIYWMNGHEELYNLQKDPREENNLILAEPEIAEKLKSKILEHLKLVKTNFEEDRLRAKVKQLRLSGKI